MIACVVSGGQTGVDRAALDAAIASGVGYGGWCPRGGRAEDHPDPPGLLTSYPGLLETPTADPTTRTRWNVRDSHATLVLNVDGVDSPGTRLTVDTARHLGRPVLVTTVLAPTIVLDWLRPMGDDLILNVAGPRESEAPGLYADALRMLTEVLRQSRRP